MYFRVLPIFFYLITSTLLHAQNGSLPEKHTVFLIGNTSVSSNTSHLKALKNYLDSYDEEFSVIHLGDLIDANVSLEDASHPELQKLDAILSLATNPKGELYIIPGDIDWGDSGVDGAQRVKELQDYIEKRVDENTFYLGNGPCPEPTLVDISPFIRLVAVNSPWWVHPYEKPIGTSTDCEVIEKEELGEKIKDAIEDAENKNVLVAMHHPVFSGGIYGGYSTPKMHLTPIPVVGSIQTAYLQNVGTPKYMSYPTYEEFKTELRKHFFLRKGLIFASAHEYNLQVIEHNSNYQLVSGSLLRKSPMRQTSGTIYKEKAYGFMALEYFADGRVNRSTYLLEDSKVQKTNEQDLFVSPCDANTTSDIPKNTRYIPCGVSTALPTSTISSEELNSPQKVSAGSSYKAGPVKKLLLGNLYRPSWETTVTVPYLDIAKEGLTPYTRGGGRQTTSLKFINENGERFTFRSVNKDPIKALPPELRKTVLVSLLRELTATQQPYGAMPVSRMLDATDILHARPKLYVLPNHPKLGVFQEEYKGLFGMLEDDPKKAKGKSPAFAGADDIDRSFTMFRKIYEDNDAYVEPKAFAKARVFDMLIGDWGRHPDNWKWAMYKEEGKKIFYPIPRDRDHSFSRWNGLIPYLANREWGRPNIENFDYKFTGVRSLNWPARHLDRLLLTSLNEQDWLTITEELQSEITDQVIDSAIQTFPKEVIPLQGAEIGEKLKLRRTELPKAVKQHYAMLAKFVDVVDSNKHEFFLIERLPNGNVQVKVYKKKKEQTELTGDNEMIYERIFLPSQTKEICLYGLGGQDIFHLKGTAKKSIKVRIIGGDDDDLIIDESEVNNSSKATLVYDNNNTKVTEGSSTHLKLADTPNINEFDREGFKYNTYLPLPLITANADDGIAFKFGVHFTRHGFRQAPYKQKYGFDAKLGTEGTRSLSAFSEWSNVIGSWYMGVEGIYADVFPFYNFFGLGNSTNKEGFENDFFRTNYKGFDTQVYLRKEFWHRSSFKFGLRLEDYSSVLNNNTILSTEQFVGIDPLTIGGFTSEFDIDFRNGSTYATKGLRLFANHQSGWFLNKNNQHFSLTEVFAEFYSTYRVLTLALKLGGAKNTGDEIPYFKYANLGQNTNLRGYLRNRFSGESSLYLNSELRLPLGIVENSVLPFTIGLTGFFDAGRVWYDAPSTDMSASSNSDEWHQGYGGGFFIAPIRKEYTLSVTAAFSDEESVLIQAGLGFYIGR